MGQGCVICKPKVAIRYGIAPTSRGPRPNIKANDDVLEADSFLTFQTSHSFPLQQSQNSQKSRQKATRNISEQSIPSDLPKMNEKMISWAIFELKICRCPQTSFGYFERSEFISGEKILLIHQYIRLPSDSRKNLSRFSGLFPV